MCGIAISRDNPELEIECELEIDRLEPTTATYHVHIHCFAQWAARTGKTAPSAPAVAPLPDLVDLAILIVDSHEDSAAMLADVLRVCGAIVLTATTAAEALACVNSRTVDLLVTDIVMAEQDGYWLIGELRARPGSEDLVIVTLSAHPTVDRKLELDIAAHRQKPVDPFALARLVGELTHRRPR